MGSRLQFNDVLLVLAAASLALPGVVLAALPGLADASLVTRGLLLVVGMTAAGFFATVAISARRREAASLREHLEQLCQFDGSRAADNATSISVKSAQWCTTINNIRDAAEAVRRQLEDAEHLRSGAAVRARRHANEARRLKEIIDGLAEPVLVIDDYDELLIANPSAQKVLGFDADSTQERALPSLVHCEALVDMLQETRRRKLTSHRTAEIELPDENGQPRPFRVTCGGLREASEKASSRLSDCHGAIAALHDISHEKAIQKRNAEFVSSVSHEMKTPLAGIKAYVELLADGDATDEELREEFLGVIDSQADRLQRLVENMLNLARIEAGVEKVSKQAQPLNELLERAVEVVQLKAEQKQIELVSDLSPMYLGVFVDGDMMSQAAINLLSNAIKYTPDGGKVTLRSRLEDHQVVCEVEDTGVGLSEEDQKNVFGRFYRVNKNKQMAEGTGLGLPLAKHIVEDVHNGQLSVQSELGQGSTFRIVLPQHSTKTWQPTRERETALT